MAATPTISAPAGRLRRPRSDASSRWLTVLRTPVAAGAGLLLAAVLVLAIIAPIVWSHRANAIDTNNILQGPSSAHWVGTDNLGRDLFFRVLVATRLSVELAVLATAIAVLVGLALGAAPSLAGRRTAGLFAAVVNLAVAFPALLLALFFAVIFGVGMKGAVLAIGFAGAPWFARLVQTLVAGVSEQDFVAAARVAGVGRLRVLYRHVLPNIAEPLIVNATIGAGSALLSFASLSFLGLGVQDPHYDWGKLLNDGLTGIYSQPVAALAPGIAVIVAGLAFNLFGEAVAKGMGLNTTISRIPSVRQKPGRPHPATQPVPVTPDVVLDVHDLSVTFGGSQGPVRPVRGVSFTVHRGEAVGVVGESGSGKSLTALAVTRLIEEPGRVDAERLRFLGADLLTGTVRAHRHLLGTSLGMVFQDPTSSFNPTQRIGPQLAEAARHHHGMTRRQASARAVDMLRAVRVPAAERRARQYPHEFSGGMRQRAMIGMGLTGRPALIVADEPTTALDVTVQRQVLELLQSVRAAQDTAIVFISHDITVVSQLCDRIMVMYAGRIVEDLPAAELTTAARHPYTRALVAAVPDMHTDLNRPLMVIPGRPVLPTDVPQGCAFAPRCPLADAHCTEADPPLDTDEAGRRVACWHAGEPIPSGNGDERPDRRRAANTAGDRA
ncbi:dipeptide/oligopeptide/nickel ABC transporter permease/ATP-binding protein [Streptomyces sp. NBC_01317]|uniref:dipeptide/oligopeptide/nickel ABC transporter permease/ATP-binding protein n=1 Tax=Streptomyces sp. NBC_01317 TaxID=2903822 RepID=UPI002E117EB0|nr:dipeptide/oligopeptide/nickel ABC transporter permease/ATP-binding protein [Streptomyces sp. NBC_01317]